MAQSCLTLCDPMDCSTPGFPVLHHLLECAQTHVHWVGDAIPPSHPLSSPSPPAFSLSQHQGLFPVSQFFASGGQGIGASASASVLPMNTQGWFSLGWTGWISLLSKGSADMFMSKTLRWEGYPGLPRWTLNAITRILRRGRKRRREIWHRGDDVTTEAEIGATWGMLAATRGWKRRRMMDSPLRRLGGAQPYWHVGFGSVILILDLWPPKMWENKFLCLLKSIHSYIYYSFGCVGSSLGHTGSLLHHSRCFVTAQGLTSCGPGAQQLPCAGLVAPENVGS